jgi:hypothetical protein
MSFYSSSTKCRYCNLKIFKPFNHGKIKKQLSVIWGPKCHFGWLNPYPSDSQLKNLYEKQEVYLEDLVDETQGGGGNWRYTMNPHINYFTFKFLSDYLKNEGIQIIRADHTLKIKSIVEGINNILPFNYDSKVLFRTGYIKPEQEKRV